MATRFAPVSEFQAKISSIPSPLRSPIFSDLVVFPGLRIMLQYFGWKMAFYILGVFLVSLVASALALHYGFLAFALFPDGGGSSQQVQPTDRFAIDYTLFLNLGFLMITAAFSWLSKKDKREVNGQHASEQSWSDQLLTWLAYAS